MVAWRLPSIATRCVCVPVQAEAKKGSLETDLDQVRKLQPQAGRLAQLRTDLRELDKKIGTENSRLDRAGPTRSSAIVNRELQKKQMEVYVIVLVFTSCWSHDLHVTSVRILAGRWTIRGRRWPVVGRLCVCWRARSTSWNAKRYLLFTST